MKSSKVYAIWPLVIQCEDVGMMACQMRGTPRMVVSVASMWAREVILIYDLRFFGGVAFEDGKVFFYVCWLEGVELEAFVGVLVQLCV